jgi:hypothetical protein
MGFSLANVVNPLTADHASLIDQFYGLLAALVFFTMNGHHALILAVQQSFDVAPVGSAALGLPPAPVLLGWGRDLFSIAARISLPVVAALLLTDIAMAVIARSVPQLNVFVVGMPAKVAVAYAKEKEKFVILGGLFGDQLLDKQGVQAIATLPSLDELRGKIIGLVQAPATKIAGVLAAPGGQLARVLNAYATKDAA